MKNAYVFLLESYGKSKNAYVFSLESMEKGRNAYVFSWYSFPTVQNTYILPLSPLFSPNQMIFSSRWFPFQQSGGLTFGRRPDPLQCEMSSHCRVAMLELKQGDVLLWRHNACNAGICNFFVSKNNDLMLHMNICELINESAALRKVQVTDQNKLIKWCHLHAPCVPSWWKQIHLHVQCLP